MTMNRSSRVPAVPTMPKGEQIASYPTYLEAQKAVDHLSDEAFPVQHVTIVGTDLRMVERVTGRLTYSRVALAGLASGAWFGLFVGLLLSIFGSEAGAPLPILPAVLIGAAFGILFAVIGHAFTGGQRDFTSSSQIVASSYAVLCDPAEAHRARGLLAKLSGLHPMTGSTATAGPTVPTVPSHGGRHAGEVEGQPLPPSQAPAPHGDPARGSLPEGQGPGQQSPSGTDQRD